MKQHNDSHDGNQKCQTRCWCPIGKKADGANQFDGFHERPEKANWLQSMLKIMTNVGSRGIEYTGSSKNKDKSAYRADKKKKTEKNSWGSSSKDFFNGN